METVTKLVIGRYAKRLSVSLRKLIETGVIKMIDKLKKPEIRNWMRDEYKSNGGKSLTQEQRDAIKAETEKLSAPVGLIDAAHEIKDKLKSAISK